MSNLQPNCCFKVDFQKVDQHAEGKRLIHDPKRRKDNQLQSMKPPCRISKLSSYMWHKGVWWTMLHPIFWKKIQWQKHPRRWDIAERQILSIKMLFKTNTKGHKHPSIRLFVIEQDTIGKPKKTKKWHLNQEPRTPRNKQSKKCDGVQLHQNWTTLLLYVYIRPVTELV